MRDSGTGSINELDGLRVLVVEDEAVVAFDLELILKDFGCTVLDLVSSNAAALEVLAQMRPDIVVLDVRLGDGSAEPVAKALSDAGIPFIVATGYDGDQIAEPLLRAAPAEALSYGRAQGDAGPGRRIAKRVADKVPLMPILRPLIV
jgi:CheY-like chemotaxis protein